MNTYSIYTSDGKRIGIVKGASLDCSKEFLFVRDEKMNIVALFPAEGGFAVVLDK